MNTVETKVTVCLTATVPRPIFRGSFDHDAHRQTGNLPEPTPQPAPKIETPAEAKRGRFSCGLEYGCGRYLLWKSDLG